MTGVMNGHFENLENYIINGFHNQDLQQAEINLKNSRIEYENTKMEAASPKNNNRNANLTFGGQLKIKMNQIDEGLEFDSSMASPQGTSMASRPNSNAAMDYTGSHWGYNESVRRAEKKMKKMAKSSQLKVFQSFSVENEFKRQ